MCCSPYFAGPGFRVLGFWGLGFSGLGFSGLGFSGLGFRVRVFIYATYFYGFRSEKTILAMVLRTYCHDGSTMEFLRLRGPYGLRV